MEGSSSFVWYEESSRRDFVRLVRSHTNEGLSSPYGTLSCERKACPLSSGTRNQAGSTSSVRYEVVRKMCLSSSIQCRESSRQHFVHLIRCCAKGGLALVHQVRGIKQAGLRPSGMNWREWRAYPPESGTRNKARWTSSVQYDVAQMESLSSFVWYKESSWQ